MVNQIHNEDCLVTLERMNSDYLDLTVTSPPYNVGVKYSTYDDNIPYDDYLNWLGMIFSKIYDKTKIGGRCVINIGDGFNGRISKHGDILQMMKEIGWLTSSCVIWEKMNSNNNCSWGSYCSPNNPSFVSTFEYVLIFSKMQYNLSYKGLTDLTKDEFLVWSRGIWKFPGTTKKRSKHPASFPIELPLRCIKMLSWKDSVIYDPFMGTGATAVACKLSNRNYIGSEISEEYCQISENRLNNTLTYKNCEFF